MLQNLSILFFILFSLPTYAQDDIGQCPMKEKAWEDILKEKTYKYTDLFKFKNSLCSDAYSELQKKCKSPPQVKDGEYLRKLIVNNKKCISQEYSSSLAKMLLFEREMQEGELNLYDLIHDTISEIYQSQTLIPNISSTFEEVVDELLSQHRDTGDIIDSYTDNDIERLANNRYRKKLKESQDAKNVLTKKLINKLQKIKNKYGQYEEHYQSEISFIKMLQKIMGTRPFSLPEENWHLLLSKLTDLNRSSKAKNHPLSNLCSLFKDQHIGYLGSTDYYSAGDAEEFLLLLAFLHVPDDKFNKMSEYYPGLKNIIAGFKRRDGYEYKRANLQLILSSKSNLLVVEKLLHGKIYLNSDAKSLETVYNSSDGEILQGRTVEKIAHHLTNTVSEKLFQIKKFEPLQESFISMSMGANRTFELLIPGKCESGDLGTYLPSFNILTGVGKSAKLSIYNRHDTDWYYKVRKTNNKEKSTFQRHYNGFYYRKSFKYDESLDLTRLSLKSKTHGTFYLKIKCNNIVQIKKIVLPDPTKKITHIKREESPNYKELDQDGTRRGLFISGDDLRSANFMVNFLEQKKQFLCKREPDSFLASKKRLLQDLRNRKEGLIDYIVRNVHANGYSHDAGAFILPNPSVRYVCNKTIDGLKHEMVIYGKENHPENVLHKHNSNKSWDDGKIGYADFLESIDLPRSTQLLMANLSCSSLSKSVYEMNRLSNNRQHIKYIGGEKSVKYFENEEIFNPQKDAALAFSESMISEKRQSYRDMKKAYPVYEHNAIYLPDDPRYGVAFNNLLAAYDTKIPISVKNTEEKIDFKKAVKEGKLNLSLIRGGSEKLKSWKTTNNISHANVAPLIESLEAIEGVFQEGIEKKHAMTTNVKKKKILEENLEIYRNYLNEN